MSNTTKIVLTAIVALVIGFVGGVIGSHQNQQPSLGSTSYDVLNQVGDIYQGMTHTLIASGGNLVGTLTGTINQAASVVNTMSGTSVMGNVIANSVVMGNTAPVVYTATSTMTTAQFCGNQVYLVQNTTGSISVQPPPVVQINAATSTCAATQGGGIQQNLWINQSTNTVTFAPVAGFTFGYSNIVATSTNGALLIQGPTSSTFTLASGTSPTAISFYGTRLTSSTYEVLVSPYR